VDNYLISSRKTFEVCGEEYRNVSTCVLIRHIYYYLKHNVPSTIYPLVWCTHHVIVHYNIIESCTLTNVILYSTCNLGQNIPTWSAAADNKHRTHAKLPKLAKPHRGNSKINCIWMSRTVMIRERIT